MTKEQRQDRLLELMSKLDIEPEKEKNRYVAELLHVAVNTVEGWKSKPVSRNIPISKLRLLELLLLK